MEVPIFRRNAHVKKSDFPCFYPPGTAWVFKKNWINLLILIELERRNILSLKVAVLHAPLLFGIAQNPISHDFPMGNDTAKMLRFGSWPHWLRYVTWKNGFIASSGEGFHHMAVIPRRTIFLGESGAVFLCNINTDKKQPRGDPPIISQVQKYFWITHHPTGCTPGTSEPNLCYNASINNPTTRRRTWKCGDWT